MIGIFCQLGDIVEEISLMLGPNLSFSAPVILSQNKNVKKEKF